ncbi:MAG TPA: type II 3-dehydroquinate dehydratase [Micropepsaceae bacterium]|nr:type II 3-dehydroquinate dehydratase [Micropepsaceae bacterium]
MSLPVYVLNGPNLNLLGTREPEIYGRQTLADIEQAVGAQAARNGLTVDFRQSNHEGVLIDWIQEARTKASAIIFNPGGYSHTSVAIHDALRLVTCPVIEVHLSNPHRREAFRHHSYVSTAATGVICGLGATGYLLAIDAVASLLKTPR